MTTIDVGVAVIGGGPAGMAAAIEAARAGVGVVLVEPGRLGGRATHATMLPWRALERAADRVAHGGGVSPGKEAFEWARLDLARTRDRWEERQSLRLEDAGVERVVGRARFTSPNELVAGNARVRFDSVVIATGGEAVTLPGDPPDGVRLLRPDDLFGLDALPEELMVIGGGAAGAELVDALSRIGGVKLTWLMDEVGILPRFDRELADALGDVIMERGVKLVHGKAVLEARVAHGQVEAKLDGGRTYAAPVAVVAIGSRPALGAAIESPEASVVDPLNLDPLNLAALGLAVNGRATVAGDADGRTSVAHVFLAGDCRGDCATSVMAEAMGRRAGRAAAGLEGASFEAGWIPRVVRTRPMVAQVGETPERVAGRRVVFHTLRLDETIHGLLLGIGEKDDQKGFVRVVCDSESGTVLGATALGPGAAEVVGAVAVALGLGATDEQLAGVFAASPSPLTALTRAPR